jgi:hypothetical protein
LLVSRESYAFEFSHALLIAQFRKFLACRLVD